MLHPYFFRLYNILIYMKKYRQCRLVTVSRGVNLLVVNNIVPEYKFSKPG